MSPSFIEEKKEELQREFGDVINSPELVDSYIAYLRWQLLWRAIEGQVDLESSEAEMAIPDNETKLEADNETIEAPESPRNNLLTEHLLEQFEVKEIPVSEWEMMHVIAEEW